jgi:hypothetical protein
MFSYVSTVLTQVNITKPCLIGGLATGLQASSTSFPLCDSADVIGQRRHQQLQ